jgi:two-component system, OmpR family, alkaline phosphatase synthesis response regulator PhoP
MVTMANERILVVDDERDILELVEYNLQKEGFAVTCVASGEEAVAAARARLPDLVVLDLMLPGVDGLEVCRRLRTEPTTRHIPIVMLTAKGGEADIVAGLELGAADYVTKPFSPRVLTARLRAVLRRDEEADREAVLRVGPLTIHPGKHHVTTGSGAIDLTAAEFRILHFLARRPGWVFTRQQLVEAAQGDDSFVSDRFVTDRSIDVHIVSLRRKLGPDGALIETVRGVGYRLKGD